MGTNLRQKVDGSVGFVDDTTGLDVFVLGGAAATQTIPCYRSPFTLEIAVAGTADTAGALCSVANPFGRSFYITDTFLVVTTQSAGACTVSFGCAANGTTLNNTCLAGANVAAVGIFGGGLIANRQEWTSSKFFTGSTATGAAASLVGKIFVTGFVI